MHPAGSRRLPEVGGNHILILFSPQLGHLGKVSLMLYEVIDFGDNFSIRSGEFFMTASSGQTMKPFTAGIASPLEQLSFH